MDAPNHGYKVSRPDREVTFQGFAALRQYPKILRQGLNGIEGVLQDANSSGSILLQRPNRSVHDVLQTFQAANPMRRSLTPIPEPVPRYLLGVFQ